MFYHLLESSHWDDSNKWSNIGFGEEIGILEMKIRALSGALLSASRGQPEGRNQSQQLYSNSSHIHIIFLAFHGDQSLSEKDLKILIQGYS